MDIHVVKSSKWHDFFSQKNWYKPIHYEEYEGILDYVFNKFGATVGAKVDVHFEKVSE